MFGLGLLTYSKKRKNGEPIHESFTQVQCCQDLQRKQVARLVADVSLLCVEARSGRDHCGLRAHVREFQPRFDHACTNIR
jgi:hypothetical protein